VYLKQVNDTEVIFPYTLRQLRTENPKTSFPAEMSDEILASWSVYPVTVADKPSVAHNEVAERQATPTETDGAWSVGWTVRTYSDDEIAAIAFTVRRERDEKLKDSDWTQANDSPLNDAKKTEWATYRTSLRDVPLQINFPTQVTWPTEPS